MDAYIYQYSVGLVFFLAGLTVAARHGYVGLSGVKLRNLVLLCSVLLVFFLAQGYLQYGTMSEVEPVAYTGDGSRPERLGTTLDYTIMVGYFLMILAIGTWFGRRQKTLNDFFFGGQRFPWWIITFSLIATVVGSYSFVKYSQAGYRFGFGSAQTYLNDWLWLPLLIFGWLPILYFSRVTSIPEYFERRFDRHVRGWVTVFILVYLVGYVGVNLFTMGKVLNILLGWPIWTAACVVATISAIYVTAGGTDQRDHDRPLSRHHAAGHRPAPALCRSQLPRWVRILLDPFAPRPSAGVSELQSGSVVPIGRHLLARRHRQYRDVLLPESGRDHAVSCRLVRWQTGARQCSRWCSS